MSALSGGEQSRLRLCMLMDEKINLLILDEPTNHLDVASREWIEEAVESYEGNLLFVSHDRYFINRFATRIWMLENGQIIDFRGPLRSTGPPRSGNGSRPRSSSRRNRRSRKKSPAVPAVRKSWRSRWPRRSGRWPRRRSGNTS